MYKGYYSRNKYGASSYGDLPSGEVAYPTIEPARQEQDALSVMAHLFVREVGTDTSESGSTDWQIEATGHAALRGDVIRITSGTHSGREIPVVHTSANVIYIADKLNIGNGITFQILRHKRPLVQADGTVVTSAVISPSPLLYVLDGVDTEVEEDSATPANNRPLPVKQLPPTGLTVKNAAISVGTSAVRLTTDGAAHSAGRKRLIANTEDTTVAKFYIGGSGITAQNGILLLPGATIEVENDAGDYYIVSDTAVQTVYVTEQE